MRNLGLIVALWLSALLPTNSLALGLGEIEVNSFLNQPLSAEIEVISARPGEIDDLLVSLASREAFARAGLSRPRHLLDLRDGLDRHPGRLEESFHVRGRRSVPDAGGVTGGGLDEGPVERAGASTGSSHDVLSLAS